MPKDITDTQKFTEQIYILRGLIDELYPKDRSLWNSDPLNKTDFYLKSSSLDHQMLWVFLLKETTDAFDSYLWNITFRNILYYFSRIVDETI